MKVLVTGICGFVGSHLADFLIEQPDVQIFGLRRWWEPLDNIEHLKERISFVEGDLTDLVSLVAVLQETKPDIVFHLAAESYVPASYRSPIHTLQVNVLGTVNLLEAFRTMPRMNTTIVICSSPEVYGDTNEIMTESTPMRPVSPYALSKVLEDQAGYMYHQAYRLRTIVTRGFAHEGPRRGDVFAVSNFAKQIAEVEAGRREPIVRVGNLNPIRTYCDIRDMVWAYWLAAQKGLPGEVYNIAGDKVMTLHEVLMHLLALSPEAMNIEIKTDPARLRPHDVTCQRADDSKFRQLTGWRPQIPFEQTLEDTLNYWRQKVT